MTNKEEYSNTYYRRNLSIQALHSVIKYNFQCATLITIQFKPASPVPFEFAYKCLSSWTKLSRRLVGGTFNYIRLTEYADPETGLIVFHFITDLPEEKCDLIAANWFMGNTAIKRLSSDDLSGLPQAIISCAENLQSTGRRGWSCSRGILRQHMVLS